MARAADELDTRTLDPRWSSRLAGGVPAFATTLATALAHAPETAAYGLVAFARLGVAFGPTAMALALLANVVSNTVASTLGAGRLVNGQRASLSLLTAGLVAAVIELLGQGGQASAAQVLALCAVGVISAGGLQVAFGLLQLGNIVKYTPYPVRVGVTSGVGLLLIVTALPLITGHRFGSGWRSAFDAPQTGAIVVGSVALVVTKLAARVQQRVPPMLIGLGAATLLHFLAAQWLPVASLGALIGQPTLPHHGFAAFDPGALFKREMLSAALLPLVGSYAATVAVLCSLDTLLTVSVVDGRLRQGRDANRELWSQGFANIAAGLVAGQPLSPSIPRTLALVLPNPRRRRVALMYATALLMLLLFAGSLIGQVPGSAIGGALLLQGVQMVAPAFWLAPLELWRLRHQRGRKDGRQTGQHMRGGDWAIELTVACSAVAFGLGPAVVIGATFAVLLFVRANMRDVVRRQWSAQTRRSLKARPSIVADALATRGSRIRVLELEGSLFFGTADGLRLQLERLEDSVDTVILDLQQVTEVDVTAARILFETAQHWDRLGQQLVFAEWPPGDARRRMIESAGWETAGSALHFLDHTDLALEQAEDRLLERLKPANDTDQALTLGDTMLGADLDDRELALLSAKMVQLHFYAGQVLFELGDQGDGLYLSLKGDIGLRIPGSSRRLASFAPGVVIGEMATLTRGTRSAQAFAESDVTALKLSVKDFERLMADHPVLAAKLLRNMSLHLANRVRTLTTDLSHLVSRTTAGPGPATAVGEQIPQSESTDVD